MSFGNAAPPEIPKTAKVQSGLVFHARASKASQLRFGITNWHTILEPGSKTFVIDGSDAKGKIRFSSAFQQSKDGTSWDVVSYTQKGKTTIDSKTGFEMGKILSTS